MGESPLLPLAGRVLLVTGGSSGIGRAIALGAARAGADVALTYRASQAAAEGVADQVRALGRRAAPLPLNLSDATQIGEAAAAAVSALGRVDVWVNSAGADILTGEHASRTLAEKLDLLIAVDLRGTILASWRAAELLATNSGGGVIVNMSWDHVLTGMPGINPQMFAAV